MGSLRYTYKYMPQAGFEPGTYGIWDTWIWDSALDHSASTAGKIGFIHLKKSFYKNYIVNF